MATQETKTSVKIATEIGVIKWAELPYNSKASRVELFVRWFWALFYGIVGFVYAIGFTIIILVFAFVASILQGIQWIVILFAGRRLEVAFNWSGKYLYERTIPYYVRLYNYSVRFWPYAAWMTDARPPLGFNASNEEYFKPIVKAAKATKAKKGKSKKTEQAEPQ